MRASQHLWPVRLQLPDSADAEGMFAGNFDVLAEQSGGGLGIPLHAGFEDGEVFVRRNFQPLQRFADIDPEQPEPRGIQAVVAADDRVVLKINQRLVERENRRRAP